jgi:hypothetical protein
VSTLVFKAILILNRTWFQNVLGLQGHQPIFGDVMGHVAGSRRAFWMTVKVKLACHPANCATPERTGNVAASWNVQDADFCKMEPLGITLIWGEAGRKSPSFCQSSRATEC